METVPFLRDVDDEKHYAQLLEVAYVEAYCELDRCLKEAYFGQSYKAGGPRRVYDSDLTYEALKHLGFVMAATVEQSVERRRRLTDITAGLADVVLDEEGAKE